MSKPTSESGLPDRSILTSFLLSLILVGPTISSALLVGLTIPSQHAWASHLVVSTLLTPTNNAITSNNRPNFDWSDVTGATSYSIQADDDPNFGSRRFTQTVTLSTYTPTGGQSLNIDGPWYWRVAAKANNPDTLGAYSTPFTVIIDTTGPPAPTLVSPLNGAFTNEVRPILDWNEPADISGINRYTLEVAITPTFGANK